MSQAMLPVVQVLATPVLKRLGKALAERIPMGRPNPSSGQPEKGFCEGVCLAGVWKSRLIYSDVANDWEEFLIEISQTSTVVTAEIKCIAGKDEGRTFRFQGCFSDSILTGYYTITDRSRAARGSMTLKLGENGRRLEGIGAIYSSNREPIFSVNIAVQRLD